MGLFSRTKRGRDTAHVVEPDDASLVEGADPVTKADAAADDVDTDALDVDAIQGADPAPVVDEVDGDEDPDTARQRRKDAELTQQELGMRAILGTDTGMTSSSKANEHVGPATSGMRQRTKRRASAGGRAAAFDFTELDKVAAEIAAAQDDEDDTLDTSKLSRKERKALEAAMGDTIDVYPHLMALKPKERYVFHSDYFQVDDQVACILAYFHDDGATDGFPAFWGINRIPGGLGEGVTTMIFEHVSRETDDWVDEHIKTTDRLDKLEEKEQIDGGTMSSRRRASKIGADMEDVVQRIQDGDAYLYVHNRLMIKAPTLAALDTAVERVRRAYIDLFTTLTVEPYHGEQRRELMNLFGKNSDKRGKGFHYPSSEFAGSYCLVTNGLNDPGGEYVGRMVGDVNTSAVLFDVDGYRERVVCADETLYPQLNNQHVVDMWGSKISQAALLNNRKVVHLVLNGCDLDSLGPKFEDLTSRVDMSNGDVNMFEIFGSLDEEISLFSVHLNKLVLMTKLLYGETDQNQAIISGKLREILTEFYVDQRMWSLNAKENREKLRLVGIPHEEVPLLQVFVAYINEAYERIVAEKSGDQELVSALSALSLIFNTQLDTNGDLFNQHTNSGIDNVRSSRRVIYEFSSLLRRGGGTDQRGVAMAQLVNIVGYAVEELQRGDTVIIHGADTIQDVDVQNYMANQFDRLRARGGRVVYLYDSVDAMISEQHFNKFHRADYTILGPMGRDTVGAYQDALQEVIPPDLASLILTRDYGLSYLRRGVSNVVFQFDFPLGLRDGQYHRKAAGKVRKNSMDRGVGWSSRFGRKKRKGADDNAHTLTKQAGERIEETTDVVGDAQQEVAQQQSVSQSDRRVPSMAAAAAASAGGEDTQQRTRGARVAQAAPAGTSTVVSTAKVPAAPTRATTKTLGSTTKAASHAS